MTAMWNESIFLEELRGLLRIPTEYDPQTVGEGAPCGANIARGLRYIRDIALRDGFRVREYGGHAIAVLYGEQERRVEAVSHVDVVPAGEGWSVPPYGAVTRQNHLYGRGTQDMKTALWLTYAALRKIREEGKPLKRQIRLVIGTDEERTMRDLVHYLNSDGLPDFAFTPDGGFPLCLGEKGDLVWYVDGLVQSRVRWLKAGRAANVVCDDCALALALEDIPAATLFLDGKGWVYTLESGETPLLHIRGKAAHASMPHLGDNAVVKALRLLCEGFHEQWAARLLTAFGDPYGSGLGLAAEYPPMGYASVGLHILSLQNGALHGEIDVRFPAPLTAGGLTEIARRRLPDFAVEMVYEEPIVLHSAENPFVRALLDNYRAHCPEDASPPYVSGGVTYAKVYAGRCAAYGPRRAADKVPILAHQTDEHISLDALEQLCNIYAGALEALSDCEG